NGSSPDSDVGEDEISGDAVAVRNVDNVMITERDLRRQPRFAQCQCHIVSSTEMLVDQRLQRDIRQNVAAIGDERLAAQMGFHIFDAATGFEQLRLVHERDGVTVVASRAKKVLEQFWKPVRIDDESAHPDVDQMIERKRYQRLLKNGNERLGNVIRQRTQAQAQSGSQDECMCDYVHKRSTEIPRRIPNAYRLRLS